MRARTASAIAVTTVGLLALSGCSGQSGSDSKDLVWSMWVGSSADQEAWQAVGNTGGEAAGATVTLQGAPFADYWTRLSTQLGTSSAPCIVSMQSLRVSQYADSLLPLNDLISSTDTDISGFDAGALKALAVGDQQYALPYDTGPMVLFYNRDLFDKAGVKPEAGWTVDDFEAAAATLKSAGTVAFGTTVEDLYLESSILAYNGGEAVSTDGTIDVSNPSFVKGVEWLAGMVEDGTAAPANGPDPTAEDNAFLGGTVASMVGGPWLVLDLKSRAPFTLGVTTVPSAAGEQKTYSAGSGFGISKNCNNPDAAFTAITAMTSEETLSTLAADGRAFPARTAAQKVWFDNTGVEGIEDTFASALESAVALPGSTKSDQFNQLLAQYGPQAVNGTEPAQDVLDEITSQLGN